ncbi:hypothetical protein VTL71DRAFT_3734 [Oculimacula yallundae]|uniref:Uncharacterized protein n=1 Tax=Oculimacula yallundae TaxID=86028 RepID=A0ABR4C3S8_9HELO
MASAADKGGIELSDQSIDLELGQSSSTGRQRFSPERSSTAFSSSATVTSLGSISTSRSDFSSTFSSVLSWRPPRSKRTNTGTAPLDDQPKTRLLSDSSISYLPDGDLQECDRGDMGRVSQAFFSALCGTIDDSEMVEQAAQWYFAFLNMKCRDAWSKIIRPVLDCEDKDSSSPSQKDLCTIFRMLRTIVLTKKNTDDVALIDIVDVLYNKDYLRHIEEDLERDLAKILVFTAIGWLTMMYTPSLESDRISLQIIGPPSAQPGGITRSWARDKSMTFTRMKQDLQLADQPLPALLKAFGNILPQSKQPSFSGQITPFASHQRPEELIEASTLCLYNLHNLMEIRIEWVDCLSLHLEYNNKTKVLRVYRFPSFCLLMCCSDTSYLSRLFLDNQILQEFSKSEQNYASSYFREVMLSYRLIFAESKYSHSLYISPKDHVSLSQAVEHDPMLDVICGQSCRDEPSSMIWEAIDAGRTSSRYSTQDFDFLGPRLLLIQKAIDAYHPQGFLPMWYDRRDIHRWWGFWPIFITSGFLLALGLLQATLQVLQLYFTLWPLKN